MAQVDQKAMLEQLPVARRRLTTRKLEESLVKAFAGAVARVEDLCKSVEEWGRKS